MITLVQNQTDYITQLKNNTVAYSSGAFLVLDYRHGFDALPVSRIKGTLKLFVNLNIFSKS